MKGNIRVKGKCSECESDFVPVQAESKTGKKGKILGYICSTCKIFPKRFYIDLFWNGQRCRIFSDTQGMALDSFDRALKLQAHIQTEIDKHSFDPSKYVKSELQRFYISTLLDRFLSYKTDSIAPSYQKDYKRLVNIAKDFFKIKDVREIRKIDLINYKEHLEKKFNLSGKSIKNIIDLFKTFLLYCKNDLEIISIVPAFPDIEIQEYAFKWLSQADQITIFELIPEEDKPIIAFLVLHGCRPSEARALKCKDADLRTQTITISATFSGRVYREKRKGRRSRAVTIPIHPEMLDFVTERVKNNLPEAFIFANRQGKHYSENALRRIWDSVREKAGISKDLRLYDATRHSFASQLVNSGTSLFKVSKLLGHSSTKMTEKYAHQNIESLKTDIKKMSLKKSETVIRLSPEAK